jgi:O-antigen/teichoic acid export membrane protein
MGWAERRFQTDISYLAKGSFWLLVGYGAQVITGIALTYLFANYLSKETYGTYQYILSVAAICGIFTLTGIGIPIGRAIAKGELGALRYGTRVQLLWSVGIFATAAATAGYYALRGNSTLAIACGIVALVQPLLPTLGLYRHFYQNTGRFKENTILDVLQRFVPFGALFIAFAFTRDAVLLIAVYFVSQALSLAAGYAYTVVRYRLPYAPIAGVVSYGKHLSVIESVNEFANAADKALVWVFLGAAPTAVYALALLPIVHLQTIFGFVRQLAFPKLVNRSFAELRETLPAKIRLYSVAAFVTVAAYIISTPFIFHILFPKYPEAVIYSQILALSLLTIPRSLITQAFLAHEMKRELYLVNLSMPIVKLAALAAGVALWGLPGVVCAFLLAELYAAVFQMYLFRHVPRGGQ